MQGKWLDGFAISASLLCLIHCLALPLMILTLPFMAVALGGSEWFHPVILMFAIPTSLYALLSGFREHGHLKSLIFGVIGILCLFFGLWIEHLALAETVLAVIGSLFLAAGHLQNIRLRQSTRIWLSFAWNHRCYDVMSPVQMESKIMRLFFSALALVTVAISTPAMACDMDGMFGSRFSAFSGIHQPIQQPTTDDTGMPTNQVSRVPTAVQTAKSDLELQSDEPQASAEPEKLKSTTPAKRDIIKAAVLSKR